MDLVINKYLSLKDVEVTERYDNREIESLNVKSKNIIIVNNIKYVPRYSNDNMRRKELPSVRLYKNGAVKSIDLEKQTKIKISKYIFSAEKIIFYNDGNIKKIFPLNGRINAYYTEEDEYKISPIYNLKFKFADFIGKVISVKFYKNGNIRSVTLWPKDKVLVNYKEKYIQCKTGFSLYENGNLESIEPKFPILVDTPIGKIEAYDDKSIGVSGEDNSLKFNEDGSVKSLVTSNNVIKVICSNTEKIYTPKKTRFKGYSDILNFDTIKIKFSRDKVTINDDVFDINYYNFKISYYGERKFILSTI